MREVRQYACDTSLEVSGPTTLSFVNNLGSSSYQHLIKQQGLDRIDTDQWYPAQQIFDLFNAILDENGGNTQPFVAMGMKIAEQSTFPPEMQDTITLPMILDGWMEHYAVNHRGGDLPPVTTVKLADNHYQLHLLPTHLYPFDLVYGMAYGFCRLLLPARSDFLVQYLDGHNPYTDYTDSVIVDIRWS